MPANVIPIYEDIAKQLHAQGHIKRPDITALAKFSLNWFASSYIHTQQLMTQQAAAMVGERSPVAGPGGYAQSQNQQQQPQQQQGQGQQQNG